jgi:hypothetical protein
MSDSMTNEMVDIARKLEKLTAEYWRLNELENGFQPVVWITNNESGDSIFMASKVNSDLIKSQL